jgi:multiple sugar transport system substrate-binding protein
MPSEAGTGKADVALVFDYASDWAWEIQPQGQSFQYFWLVFHIYRGLRRLGLNVDIVPPDGADLSLFLGKRMAITQDGYWYGGNFIKAPAKLQADIRMAPAPVMGDKRVSPCYVGMGAWIPAKAKNKDAAWKLMEYFMAGPPAEERAKSGWGMPSLKSLLTRLPQELPYQQEAYKTAQAELAFNAPMPDSPYITPGNWVTILNKHVDLAIRKKVTVDVAAQKITEDVNKLLKQGKDRIG